MVGIPRSKGCRICVKRRVRCDLTRPTCNNCARGNRPCPGYDSDLRIFDEGYKLRKRFGQIEDAESRTEVDSASPSTSNNSQSTESSPEESIDLISRSNTPDLEVRHYRPHQALPARNPFWIMLENQIYPDADLVAPASTPGWGGLLGDNSMDLDVPIEMTLNDSIYSPSLVQEQLLNTFSSSIGGHGSLLLPRQMRNHQNWLVQLPGLFGSKLLDTAVRAVSLVHLGQSQRTDLFVQESRQHYGKALRLLNQSLMDDTKGMSTETLSATILLSFYEMFASDSNQSWVRHAGGAGMLMRIRGPTRHLSGLDRDVYLAYRHTIVIEAFMRDEACFLAEPQWVEMSKKIHEDLRNSGVPGERMDIFDLAEEFYLEHIFIPTTLRDAKHLEEARRELPPDLYAAHEEALLARTRLHRANLKSINLRFRAALKRQGLQTSTMETMDPVFPKQYVFVNVFVASTHVGYWTIMVMLNLILKGIEKDVAPEKHELYIMENREIARDMCRTAPFMLTSSFLGPFFIIFALRLCLMVFEPGQERDWVLRKLHQIGDTHMRMASDIPRFDPKGNIYN
ncbi:uncharacterized protein Z520_05852 [Fonsecaea multimorphosa CBS 102226]|uniref:Zn(2)-C6 fungal-type domain-containing protein n=1 Tax=Fonsecaea multimorphosa CBS 102226 TaxID=1442371 RepID=A0A0D2INE5_9EURO|nr:uncharacterized protein Z520_05852 [Fonsecaea multimorphosa CBS 102226]KIX98551.1 hypothetical protein Z520_05852 [Fonsecaea multimorphosa CBS 102226]OAL24742.1 hypothetical protein AYO22_05531 [Fonsecaea multimorphosa]